MAIIPRAQPAGAVPSGPTGLRSPQRPTADFSQAATLLGQLGENMLQQRRTNEVAKKKIEIYKRLGTLESEVSTGHFRMSEDLGAARAETPGGDFSQATVAFDELSGVLREEILSDIDDPRVRETIELEFDMMQAQKTATVRNAAVKQMRDSTVAQLDVNTELFAKAFTEATTEQERLAIVQSYRDELVGAVSTGAITRQDMVSRSQDFRNTVAELGVRKDLLGATRDAEASEQVLNRLREPGGYAGLTPEARQQFEEQAQRQFNSAVDFEFRMEERRERRAERQLKKRQEQRTRELSALIRPPQEDGTFGDPQIGHVEIDRAFQAGEITAADTNYLRSLIERPEPDPDPLTRFTYLGRFTEQAYDGTLNNDDVLRARTAGYLTDNDVTGLIALGESRDAGGGPMATNEAKQALEFVNSYLFGVKSIFNVQLTDDTVKRLGVVELQFNGRVGRGENPFRVAADLIQEDSRASIDIADIPPQAQDLFREHRDAGTLSNFWGPAREAIENDDSLTLTQRRSLVIQLEGIRESKGNELTRLPEVLNELRLRAETFDRSRQ